jgi:ATP-dependent helicase/nuclease subunit A
VTPLHPPGDLEARLVAQRVFDVPVVLEAGAGTGKTTTLVARVAAWALGPGWTVKAAELPRGRHEDDGAHAERVAGRILDTVLAITFTEAAAAEMAARVAEVFAAAASGAAPEWLDRSVLPTDEGELRLRAAKLLVGLDRLTVCTIHAYCRNLLATYPLEAGLHPELVVDAEEVHLEQAISEVVEGWLREAFGTEPDEHLGALAVAGRGPSDVAAALAALRRAGVRADALARDPFAETARRHLLTELRTALDAFLADARPPLARAGRSPTTHEVLAAVMATSGVVARPGVEGESLDALCDELRSIWTDAPHKRLAQWARDDFNLTEAKAVEGGVRARVVARARELDQPLAVLRDASPALLGHARAVLAPLLRRVEEETRAAGVESFDDLLRDARDLLAGRPVVVAQERKRWRQVLVDEFQDTDVRQCDLIAALALGPGEAQPPGLFLVGDPKQSIYGWRQADLAAYEAFLGRVRARGGVVARLDVNFRSAPVILKEIERAVGPVMVAEAGVQPPFQRLLPCPAKESATGFRVSRWAPVELWVVSSGGAEAETSEAEGSLVEKAAAAVANDVRRLHEERAVPFADVGLLLRTSTSLPFYLQALRDAGVPYAVERDRSYYRRREVIDAAALVRVLLDPSDHLALVTWLRSPLVGVPDAALLPLWRRRLPALVTEIRDPEDPRLAEVEEIAHAVARDIPAGIPGIERVAGWELSLAAGVRAVAALRLARRKDGDARWVERIRTATLLEAGEAARYLGAYRLANLERFFRTLLGALEESGGDQQAVLRLLRRAVGERREYEEARPREAAEEAVRVMTVHRAKGLDFGHVYLVQAHQRARRNEPARAEAEELDGVAEYRLLGVSTPGWGRVEERRRRVASAELVRTLYVALTRAKERLVVVGDWGKATKGLEPATHIDLLAHLLPAEEDLGAMAERLSRRGEMWCDMGGVRWVFPFLDHSVAVAPVPHAAVGVDLEAVERDVRQLAACAGAARASMRRPGSGAASEEAHRLLREELLGRGEEETRVRPVAPGDVATLAGTIVHTVLERLDLAGDLRQQISAAVDAPVAWRGAPEDQALRRSARQAAAETLERFVSSPLLTRLEEIAEHVVAREVAVLIPPEEGGEGPVSFVSGAIDLLYRDLDDGRLVVADFKTDRLEGEDEIASRAEVYRPQLTAYATAIRSALHLEDPPHTELWFLQPGRIVRT